MTVEQSAIAGRVVVRRPDIPLRVAAFWCGYSAIFIGLGFVLALAPPSGRMLVAGLLVTIASIALTRVLTRSEGASLATAGAAWSRGSVARFSSGMVFGGVMIALLVGLSRAAIGPVAFVRNPDASLLAVPMMIATYVALAAGEELGFRGYPFHRLRDRYGTLTAQVVVALAFAAYHVLQGWPVINALLGTTAGSLLFGTAVVATRGLAFPIGLHAAWNLGSWVLGTNGEAGVWRMDLGSEPSFGTVMAVYLAVMAAGTCALWRWMPRADVNPAGD